MKIKPEQEKILSSCTCVRVRDVDSQILQGIVGARVSATKRSHLIGHFRNKRHLHDESKGHLASYLVLSPYGTVLIFFSLRCGELFEKVDHDKIKIARDAHEALLLLQNSTSQPLEEDKRNQAFKAINNFRNSGLTFDDLLNLVTKKSDYEADEDKEPNKLVSRVSKVYSGVELKFYGLNDNGLQFWSTTGLPRKMGLTLYWRFIIPKLEELQNVVGCQYMYLFAADEDPDGHLVNYYRTAMHINANHFLSSNKPHFDYSSVFLYQEIAELKKQRDYFFETFNIDSSSHDII